MIWPGEHVRRAIRTLTLALALSTLSVAPARAQLYGGYGYGYGGYGYAAPAIGFGYAAPTFGFGYGYPGPAIGYAYGYPAVGFGGTPGFGYGYGYGYPSYGYGFYANAYPAPIATPFPAGYSNPMFATGLTPLGVQGGLTDAYLANSTRRAGTAYVPANRQYGGTGSAMARPPAPNVPGGPGLIPRQRPPVVGP
jgi:hypothetical protein